MEKRNLKLAIAKFEELAADEEYEGNRKIINLDAFLKTDLKSNKKKKKESSVNDNFESTPIKCNKESKQLDDSFDNQFDEDSSSSEIKTADQFLKQFLSQSSMPNNIPQPLIVAKKNSDKMKKKPSKSKAISLLAPKQTKNKSVTNQSNKSATNKKLVLDKSKTNKSTINKTSAKKSTIKSAAKSKVIVPTKSNQKKQTKELKFQKDGELKLREREKQFLLTLHKQRSMIEKEDYDDEDSEYDEQLSDEDEELTDEELSDEELSNKESLDDESIDPESSGLIDDEQLKYLRRDQDQSDVSIDNEETYSNEEKSNELTELKSPSKMYLQKEEMRNNRKLVKQTDQSPSKAIAKVNNNLTNYVNSFNYVTDFEYQKAATEELYKLILKSEECSFNVLSKLVKNIKQTLNQDELPDPSRIKPFFHFTPDNQIHVTFLFINPKDIYYNPWESIISKNYSNLNILFEKIYDLIFNFNILVKKRRVQSSLL